MSDEDNSPGCCDPPKSKVDVIILIAMVSVFTGLIISTVGYLIPQNYDPDPSLSAREQEAVDLYYFNLSVNLDICVVVGMGFIALGGILTSAVVCKTLVFRECETGDEREDGDYILGEQPSQQNYGTVESGQERTR